jgi:PD-(D/E)XK nuclease superfamily
MKPSIVGSQTTPGRLIEPYGLIALKRISPSRYIGLQECPLREVWRAAGCPALLPKSPRAWVGTIVHEMLQMAATGRFNGMGPVEIGEIWNLRIHDAENTMRLSWLDSSSVPLVDTVWDLEVQKTRTIRRVREMSKDDASPCLYDGRSSSSSEVWMETPDHSVGGFVDSVIEVGHEIILRDFKSGLVNDLSSGSETVKPEYIAQLELYCGVFFEVNGLWPTALEVVPVVGEPVRIQVDRARCLAIVQGARDTFYRINKQIESGVDNREGAIRLANPSPGNCVRCEYRPNCASYKSSSTAMQVEGGPVDIIGQVLEIASFSNGSSAITITTNSGVRRVKGMDSRHKRHPALALLQLGSPIGIYSLKAIREKRELVQGPATTVYLETPPEA